MFDYKCDPGTLVGLNLKRNQTGLFSLSIFLLIFFFFLINQLLVWSIKSQKVGKKVVFPKA